MVQGSLVELNQIEIASVSGGYATEIGGVVGSIAASIVNSALSLLLAMMVFVITDINTKEKRKPGDARCGNGKVCKKCHMLRIGAVVAIPILGIVLPIVGSLVGSLIGSRFEGKDESDEL